jgi:alanine dehydrogenase
VKLSGEDPVRSTELGELLAGKAPGRRSAEELTVYKSMGQAAVAARLVYERGGREGAGQAMVC